MIYLHSYYIYAIITKVLLLWPMDFYLNGIYKLVTDVLIICIFVLPILQYQLFGCVRY